MPDSSALLARIPDEFKPMAALAIGAFMLVFLVLLHGAGLHGTLVLRKRRELRLRAGRPNLARAFVLFGSTVFLMLSLHIAGFMIWAYALRHIGLIPHAYDAIYFCANAYTTLGYGNVDLDTHWRIISPIIGISGLFTFAWTTSALVDVVASHHKLIGKIEGERKRRILMGVAALKDKWDALKGSGTKSTGPGPDDPDE
jgi:Ion channel